MVEIKRRVIQIANSTQLISLPRKWTIQHNIKKGDELDVQEDGSKIILSTDFEDILRESMGFKAKSRLLF